jgi:UTP--glucose-1-phosphate uridylyltransferase
MSDFSAFERKMSAQHLPDIVVRTFKRYYELLLAGEIGMMPESSISPLGSSDVVNHQDLASYEPAGVTALRHTAVLKLNGGLGTSMGLSKAKSLIEVRNGMSFLDCAVLQVRAMRRRYDVQIPFVLMNSFSTDADALRLLQRYPDINVGLPLRFLQHKFPKVHRETLEPVTWKPNPALEWNPPGHGDLYPALVTSTMLAHLRHRDIRYLFVSNSDNLGAVLDLHILGHFAKENLAFLMEVAERTPMDSKGGHIARGADGRLVLRESAQCPEGDISAFQDTNRHRFFNTNNLWINVDSLAKALAANDNVLPLPLIVNPKTVDPAARTSPPVYQLESAMGAAIGVFDPAAAVLVSRERFVPVKKCGDLLAVWSDRFVLDRDYRLTRHPEAPETLTVNLDKTYYTRFGDFAARFPTGAPSLRACTSFTVSGDVKFSRGVTAEGDVTVRNRSRPQATVSEGTKLNRETTLG